MLVGLIGVNMNVATRRIIIDSNGEIELPFKLLIIAIVLAIVIPALFFGLRSYSINQMESNVRSELTKLQDAIDGMVQTDVGSSDVVKLNLDDGFIAELSHVKIGDEFEKGVRGPDHVIIRYKISGRKEKFLDTKIPVTNADRDGPFEVGGSVKLVLLKRYDIEMGPYVTITRSKQ